MRFLDDLIRAGLPWSDEIPVINADNVARYVYRDLSESVKGESTKAMFPNLAPPFENMVIEWSNPRFIGFREKKINFPVSGWRCLVLFAAFETSDLSLAGFEAADCQEHWDFMRQGSRARWFILMRLYADRWFPTLGLKHLLSMSIGVDDSGQLVSFINDWPWRLYHDSVILPNETNIYVQSALFFPCLFALCFMNCKNVVVRDQPNPPRLVRRHTKLYGRPPITYKTLDIQPMQKILRDTADAHGVSVSRAMHFCRGHFKDYREHGLFGRTKGVYFWPQMVRGTLKAGLIKKDYRVFPPKESPDGSEGNHGSLGS